MENQWKTIYGIFEGPVSGPEVFAPEPRCNRASHNIGNRL